MRVCKFGGTSLADAQCFAFAKDIVLAEPRRKYVVVSAPGRVGNSQKITDMLIAAADAYCKSGLLCLDRVRERFFSIASKLGLNTDLDFEFDRIEKDVLAGAGSDYLISRGEYITAKLFAEFLGFEFVDAADIIRLNSSMRAECDQAKTLLKNKEYCVISGFYAKTDSGRIKVFSRGGSDITGALVATAVECEVYENFTDVDGFMICDPLVVDSPALIEILTYRELRELSYMGANVLHPESIFPLKHSGIPINIKNTFNPGHDGTLIVPTEHYLSGRYMRFNNTPITGIAGRKGFCSLQIDKAMMNNEIGFTRNVLSVFGEFGVTVEHIPGGIDTMSFVFDSSGVEPSAIDSIIDWIKKRLKPDSIELIDKLALIAVVGHGMSRRKGAVLRICSALYNADIDLKMINKGSSEISVIVAVCDGDYNKAIRALYYEFFKRGKGL